MEIISKNTPQATIPPILKRKENEYTYLEILIILE